jgi:methylglyoxal synthase
LKQALNIIKKIKNMKVMNLTNKLSPVKRVAFVASRDKTKDLIEWSYYNKTILATHEIIATSQVAYLLEGTMHQPVTRLSGDTDGGYEEMAQMILAGKVDVILFFDNPLQNANLHQRMKKLLDAAIDRNIQVAFLTTRVEILDASAISGRTDLDGIYAHPDFLGNEMPGRVPFNEMPAAVGSYR